MPLPTQWARVAFNFTGGEKPWQMIIFYTLNGAFPGTWNIQLAAAALDSKFGPRFTAILNLQNFYNGVDLRVNNAGIVSTLSTFPNSDGTLANDPTPDEVAFVVRLQTDQPGKSGRGRIFMSGLDSGSFLNGRLTPSAHTLAQALGTEIQTHMTDQTVDWHAGVFSRKTGSIHDIVATSVPVTVATQRRRRTRR